MTMRYKTVTTLAGVAVLLFVLGVEATPVGSSFDGYYYQKPIFDNDNLDDGTVVHEDDPPLLTYHEDPDERKDTTYLCTIHNCGTGDDSKVRPDLICSALGCGKLSAKVGLANAAKASSEHKRKDNSTFGEILSLLKTFSFKELSSLQSNLTQKLATMKEEEKLQGKRTTMMDGFNTTLNSTADELKMQKENEHFFVSVDKFNKLLESLSDETAAGGHGANKKGKKLPPKSAKHIKTPAILKKPHKQDLKLKTKNKNFQPTITQFNKLFEELTSSKTLDTLRTKTSGSEPPYGQKLLQLLYAFNNTLNSLPDEKPKKKKFAGTNLLKDGKNKLPVSITTNKSLAGDVHVKVTVTLDDDASAKQHNTAKRRNQTAIASNNLNATTTSDENMKFQLANMLNNIGGKSENNAVASSTVSSDEGKAGEGEEGSGIWAPELKSEMNNISKSMEDGTGTWLKDINSKVQNLSKSIADYSISTLRKMHGADSGDDGSGSEGSGETTKAAADTSSTTTTTGATDDATATVGTTDTEGTTATNDTPATSATSSQTGTDGTAASVKIETPEISTSNAENPFSFLNSTAPSAPQKNLHTFENAFDDDNFNVDKKNATSQSSLIDSLTPLPSSPSSSTSGTATESSPAAPPPLIPVENSSSAPSLLSSSSFAANGTNSPSPSASPPSSSFIDFFDVLISNESASQKPKPTDHASETPSSSNQFVDKTVSSQQASGKLPGQQGLEKSSSDQALEKPSSSEKALQTQPSTEQASKKPSSTEQASEKPSVSEQALERLTSMARNISKSAHLISLPASTLKVFQTSRLPPSPPDQSQSKALPGETPLEHLKRLTQNMTKPNEDAVVEPDNSTTNNATTEPILSPAGSAIASPTTAPAGAPGASAAAALFKDYHLTLPQKDLTKDISQIDFSVPPPSTNMYQLKQMSKMGKYNLSHALVSDKETSSANKILGDLHQLLKINSSTSDAGVTPESSPEPKNSSNPFFDIIVNELRSNHSVGNQNEATKNDGISPNKTESNEPPTGEVSKTESDKVTASFKELHKLLNHKPNSSSNSFENDENNKTGAKGSLWYNVNNDLLTNLYNGLKGNGSNAPKPDTSTISERLGKMPDGNLTQKEIDKEKLKDEPKETSSFSLDNLSNRVVSPSETNTPSNFNTVPSETEPSALPSWGPIKAGFGPGKDGNNANIRVSGTPSETSEPGSTFTTQSTLLTQNTTQTPELPPHTAPNRWYNDETELIEALKTHIKNLTPEKPPENNQIEETPKSPTDAEEQKWYQNTENLVQMLRKNVSHTLPSRWYHDEQELVEALKIHLATISPGKLYSDKTDFAEPGKNVTKSPEEQKWFQDTTNSVDLLRKNLSHALPSRWFYDESELVEALRTHLSTISPGKLYAGKEEVNEADKNKTRSPEEMQWFHDTDSSVDSLRKNLTHAIPSRWFHNESELVDALKTHLDTISPNKVSQQPKLDLSKHSENVTRSPEEEKWFQDTTQLVDSLRKNISRAIPSRWFHDENELIDALKTHLHTIWTAKTENFTDLPQNFSSLEEKKWFEDTTLLVDSLRKNITHAVPTRWYHDEEDLIEALKTHLDTIQPNHLSRHNSHLEYDEPAANATGIPESLLDPEDQSWFADTTRLMDLLKQNLSDALPDKFSQDETNLLSGLRNNLSAHSPNKWFKDTNQFIDSLKENLTSVTLYVKDGESRKMFGNRKEQGKKALNKLLLRKKVQEHSNSSSIDKFEKLLTLLSTKKFAGDKNWKHNTYLHLSITTFEDLFKNLVGRAHQSKEELMKFFSHTDTANKEKNSDSSVRHNGTSTSVFPPILTGNSSYLDATVKFAKENGVEEEEIAKLQGNTSDYKFRKLLKLLTFKEMLKRFHNQTRNGTLEDRSSGGGGSNDVKIQASFIRKIETLLKLLAFNRIFEDWEEAEGGGEGGGNGAPGAKITNMLSDLGGHITSNVSSSGTVVNKTPTVASTTIMSSSTNSNGSTSLSNRNVVHGHYSKVAEYMNANPAQVTSRVRKIYDEPVQPPFLGYGTLARKSDPAEVLIDNVVKLHTIRKPTEEEKVKTFPHVGKIVKNPVRLRSRVKANSRSTSQNTVHSPPVSFFDYNQNAVIKSPLMNANQGSSSYTQQKRPQSATPATSEGYYGQNIARASSLPSSNLQWNPYTRQYTSQAPAAQNMYQRYGNGNSVRNWRNTQRVGFADEYTNRDESVRRPEVVHLNHAVVRSSRKKNHLHIATTGSVRSGIHRHMRSGIHRHH